MLRHLINCRIIIIIIIIIIYCINMQKQQYFLQCCKPGKIDPDLDESEYLVDRSMDHSPNTFF